MKLNYSPWGHINCQQEIGGGIIAVSTPSHGGYYVPLSMYMAMPSALRVNPYGGGTWFEEDCEWALVVLAFPQYFRAPTIEAAEKTIRAFSKPDATYYRANQWLAARDNQLSKATVEGMVSA